DLAPDVGGDLAAEVTFDLVVRVDPLTQLLQVLFGQRVDPRVTVHAGRGECLGGPGAADAVYVGQRDLKPLLTRQVDARETCHTGSSPSCGGGPPHRSPPLPEAGPGLQPGVMATRPSAVRVYFMYSVISVPASWLPDPARIARSGECGGSSPTRYKTSGKVAGGHRTASCLPLALLVPGVRADHHDAAVATDDPALAADLLDARLDLHGELLPDGGVGRCPPTRAPGLGVTPRPLLVPVNDATAAQIVGTELNDHPVIRQDTDVVHPHLPADVGEYLVPIVQLHSEEGVGQRLDHRAFDLDGAVFL